MESIADSNLIIAAVAVTVSVVLVNDNNDKGSEIWL
jgi:hypothetical protein